MIFNKPIGICGLYVATKRDGKPLSEKDGEEKWKVGSTGEGANGQVSELKH
jgi:hypothetical protein